MFNDIREVKKTTCEDEVNRLVKEGWVLKDVMRVGVNYQYLLMKE